MNEEKVKVIMPGIAWEENGEFVISVKGILESMAMPYTPQNEALVTKYIRRLASMYLPCAKITEVTVGDRR